MSPEEQRISADSADLKALQSELTTLRAENAALFLQLNEQLERADSLAHSVIELENKLVAQSASLLALQQAVAVKDEALRKITKHTTPMGSSFNRWYEEICGIAYAALSLSPDSTLMGRVVEVLTKCAEMEAGDESAEVTILEAHALLAELKQPQI